MTFLLRQDGRAFSEGRSVPRFWKILSLFALLLLLCGRSAAAFPDDDEDKKKAEAARAKKAFDALMTKADEEYRVFFKRPEQVHEFWAAMKFEMDTGKYDLAALHLKLMLALPEEKANPELLKIVDRESLGAFTRLQTVRIWSVHEPFQVEAEKNVQSLLDRVKKALKDHLSSPKRINFFIENLAAKTREEREFAKAELNRSKLFAVPHMVDTLRLHAGKTLGDRIVEYMVEMDEDMVAPLLEIFKVPFPDPGDAKDKELRDKDAGDVSFRVTLMDILKKRNDSLRARGFPDDTRLVPYLWHIAGGEGTKTRISYHPLVRKKARELLSYYLKKDADHLTKAELMLTDMAERFYQRTNRFKGDRIPLWRWNSLTLTDEPIYLTAEQAREIFTLRYAKEALDLAPSHVPAQVVLLSMQMESLYRPGVSKFLLDRPGEEWAGVEDLLARVDADLLARVLDKAMDDNNVPVILGAIRALGRRGDAVAAKVIPPSPPRGLVRALDYPDRRVQWSALQAIVKMPITPPPYIATRMMDLIARQLKTEPQPLALVIGLPDAKAPELKTILTEMGFTPVLERTFKAGFNRLKESADYDLVILHTNLGAAELPYHLTQIRADLDHGMVPAVVISPLPKVDDPTKERDEKERKANIAIIEKRTHEEKGKKIREAEVTIKDRVAREGKIAELERMYGALAAERVEEFNKTFEIHLATRRLAKSREYEEALASSLRKHRHVTIVPELHLGMPEEFRKKLEEGLDRAYVTRMTAEERTRARGQALDLLWRMGKGEIAGYNIASAKEALLTLAAAKTTPPELTELAMETISRLPGTDVQKHLAAVALNPARDKVRMTAALELNRHVKKHGFLLGKDQLLDLRKAHASPDEDAKLKEQFALVLGAAGASPRITGDRLFEFRPTSPPAKKDDEKKEKKEKEDDKKEK